MVTSVDVCQTWRAARQVLLEHCQIVMHCEPSCADSLWQVTYSVCGQSCLTCVATMLQAASWSSLQKGITSLSAATLNAMQAEAVFW